MFQTPKNIKDSTINIRDIKGVLVKSIRRKMTKLYNNITDIGKENIDKIVCNVKSHFSTCFKENLINMDSNEFLKRFYSKNEPRHYLRKLAMFYNQFQILFPNLKPSSVNKQIYINAAKKDFILNYNSENNSGIDHIKQVNQHKTKPSCFNQFFNYEDYLEINKDLPLDSNYHFSRKLIKEDDNNLHPYNIKLMIADCEDSISSVEQILKEIDYSEKIANDNKSALTTSPKRKLFFKKKAEEFLKDIEENVSLFQKEINPNSLIEDLNSFHFSKKNNNPCVSFIDYNNIVKSSQEKQIYMNNTNNNTTSDHHPKYLSKQTSKIDMCISNSQIKENTNTEEIKKLTTEKNSKTNYPVRINLKTKNLHIFYFRRNNCSNLNNSKSPNEISEYRCLNSNFTRSKIILPTKENKEKKSKVDKNFNSRGKVRKDSSSITSINEKSSRVISAFMRKIEKKDESIDLNRLIHSQYQTNKDFDVKSILNINTGNLISNNHVKNKSNLINSEKIEIETFNKLPSIKNLTQKNKPKSLVPSIKKNKFFNQISKKLN